MSSSKSYLDIAKKAFAPLQSKDTSTLSNNNNNNNLPDVPVSNARAGIVKSESLRVVELQGAGAEEGEENVNMSSKNGLVISGGHQSKSSVLTPMSPPAFTRAPMSPPTFTRSKSKASLETSSSQRHTDKKLKEDFQDTIDSLMSNEQIRRLLKAGPMTISGFCGNRKTRITPM